MRRLRQNNSGAALPLHADEVVAAFTTQTLASGGWCHVRMRVARSREAERSVHLYDGPSHTTFHHEWILLSEEALAEVVAALQAACREREAPSGDEEEDDPQAVYRTLVFRDADAAPRVLAVEYEYERPLSPAAAFEAAWHLLANQFPGNRGNRPFPELSW